MTIKITTPNGGADSLDFGSAQTAIVATVTGTEVSSGEGKLELKTTTGGTSATKMTIAANGTVTLTAPLPLASGGTGATALTDLNVGIGVGQTWTDVSASRATSTNYTNSTGKPIAVAIGGTAIFNSFIELTVGGVVVSNVDCGEYYTAQAGTTQQNMATSIVPDGVVYSIVSTSVTLTHWIELR